MNASLLRMVGSLTLALVVAAEEPDDDYVRLYRQLQQADELLETGHSEEARREFIAVREALLRIKTNYPAWNPQVVQFRLGYVSQKLGDLPAPDASPAAERAVPSELDQLRQNLRQLEVDRDVLQAKLREALAARPAAVDPGELAKAEEKIRAQEKEIETLKAQSRTNASPAGTPARSEELAQARQALARARLDLATQGDALTNLLQEKQALQDRLKGSAGADDIRAVREENETLKTQLEKLQEEVVSHQARVEALLAERRVLENRVGQLAGDRDADLSARTSALSLELTAAREQRTKLETEARRLRAELSETRAQLDRARTAPPIQGTAPTPDLDRLHALEQERAELRTKLDGVTRELLENRLSTETGDPARLTNQIEALQSRVAVLESRRAPFSAEDLALFKIPDPTGLPARQRSAEQPSTTTNTSSTPLVSARLSAPAGSRDRNGTGTSSPPPATSPEMVRLIEAAREQLAREQFPEAERALRRALAESPQDSQVLSLLGQAAFRQNKMDDALEVLSHAAQADPSNAATFTFLGLTLSRKGLREPAEAALWRAVQLSPSNGIAHYNLAVIYLTQEPPLVELARFHYQKAVAAGLTPEAGFEKRLAGPAARAP